MLQTLVPGSLVLGQVTRINARGVSLALPNNLTGAVPLTAVSAQLTQRIEDVVVKSGSNADDSETDTELDNVESSKVFTLGQYLRAYVTSTVDQKGSGSSSAHRKRIELSVDPRLANSGISPSDLVVGCMVQASVKSVEDHGFIMDLGLEKESVKGFLSTKELGAGRENAKVEEGAVFLCLVTGVSSNGKVIKLSADHRKAGKLDKSGVLTEASTVNVFLPGAAVEIIVSEVSGGGIAGKIMGMVDATADVIHSGLAMTEKKGDDQFKVGSKIKARVLNTFPTSDNPKIGISVLGHILRLASSPQKDSVDPLQVLPLSSFIEEAKVFKVERSIGLFMDVGVPSLPGFAHITRLSDKRIEALSETMGDYALDSTHRARVVGFSPLDGLYQISLEQKILDQPFLRVEDINPGQVAKGTVEKLTVDARGAFGVSVRLAEGITGWVPAIHLADINLQHPERRFREGMAVTARVLSVDTSKRNVLLTLKKALVNSEASPWSSYDIIKPGSQSPGTLTKFLPSGAIVSFYARVKAFLPRSEMSEAFIDDPAKHFKIGQVVNVYALSVDPAERSLKVSCKEGSVLDVTKLDSLTALSVGQIVSGTVTEMTTQTITVLLSGTEIVGTIKIGHLSDGSEQKNAHAMKGVRVGQTLKDLLILEKSKNKPLAILSSKPSLVKASRNGSLVTQFEDLQDGRKVDGFVRNITVHAVFVQFTNGIIGLLPKEKLPQEWQQLPDFGLRIDQSISATVASVDQHNQRFWLSIADEAPHTEEQGQSNETVSNPVDPQFQSSDALTVGKRIMARITAVKDSQLNVQLADNVQGRVDVSEAFDDWDDIKDRKHPLRKFRAKQVIPVSILGIHDARNHRFLPITHRAGKHPVFELSAKTKSPVEHQSDILTLDKVEVGSSWIVFVNNHGESCVWVNLTPNIRGRIELRDLSDNISLIGDLEHNFPIGSAIRARVKKVDVASNRLDLSATSNFSSTPLSLDTLSQGTVTPAKVTKVTEQSLVVQLSDDVSAPIGLTELSDDFSQASLAKFKKNDVVRVCVLDVDADSRKITLSMRPSQVLSSSLPVRDPYVASISDLKVNSIYRGFVKHLAEKGMFVRLGPTTAAFVRVCDLSDGFIKEWKAAFAVNQLVTGRIIAIDLQSKYIQMSLKTSVVDSNYAPLLTFSDVKSGQIVTGKVRKVEDFGVFIVIDKSANVSGLCHRSQIADEPVKDVKKLYAEGDKVKAMVMKVEPDKRRINFSLKASHFKSTTEEDSDLDDELSGVDVDMEDVKETETLANGEGGPDTNMQPEEGIVEPTEVKDEEPSEPTDGLDVGGFDWTGTIAGDDDNESASQSDELDLPTKKKRKRKAEIKIDMTGDLDKYGPQSVADFERQLLGQPNSSSLWIQYMAFQLQLNEVGKARDIAERALRTIHIREEEEKMNVWIALLNLENAYGNDESIEDVFKRACQYNDTQEMHERLASIYIDSGKHEVGVLHDSF